MKFYHSLAVTVLLLSMALPGAAHAAMTAAGVNISNTATVTFTPPGGDPETINSNTATIQVDEILDVTVVSNDAGYVSALTPSSDNPLSFTVTNTGNGSEAFELSILPPAGADQFDPANIRIYLDDGDGIFEILEDTLLGVNPSLDAGASRVVFVVSNIPEGLTGDDLGLALLKAEAVTALITVGADEPGFTFEGQGSDGSDAVVGGTQADATAENGYIVPQVTGALEKTQSVLDGFGGANAISGATITYTLTFTVTGDGTLTGVGIADPIPASTTYVAGSLTLDSGPLTDAGDPDAGRFTGSAIEVSLGDVSGPATHTVTFKVTIN